MPTDSPTKTRSGVSEASVPPDDLSREVYGVMGIPVDAVDMPTALRKIEVAAAGAAPFLISTPNLNFLVTSQSDDAFRESLLQSDLCTADGMPILWIARLLGIPIKRRIAGSDIFEALKAAPATRAIKVFLFGGPTGVAPAACEKLNAEGVGLTCVGYCEPGFGSVVDMSSHVILSSINSSGADFLVVALGANKGQAWLLRNHARLHIPVRVHLGATINFQAGTVRRAPTIVRKLGLEWLWRIKEEPQLWSRYWGDGLAFLAIIAGRVVPLLALSFLAARDQGLVVNYVENTDSVLLSIAGDATARNITAAAESFRRATAAHKRVVVNFADTRTIDARFFGLLLMLKKRLQSDRLEIVNVSARIERQFRLNCFEFLLRN